MIVSIASVAMFSGILSYACFFRPNLLSQNISTYLSIKKSGALVVLSLVGSLLLFSLSWSAGTYYWAQLFSAVLFMHIGLLDTYSKIIPNRLLIILSIIALWLLWREPFIGKIYSALLLLAGMVVLNIGIRRLKGGLAFGWGDVKLISILGVLYGQQVFWILGVAIMTGGLYGMILLGISHEYRTKKLPFALFLFIAFLLVQYTPVITVFRDFMSL